MAIPLGLDAVIQYASDTSAPAVGGSPGAYTLSMSAITSANFTELSIVSNVTLNMSKAEADITTRGTNGWRAMRGTLKEATITTDIMWDTANALFQDVFNAWLNNTTLSLLVVDGYEVGGQGLYADFDVIQFEKSEALEDAQRVSVTFKLTFDSTKIDGAYWVTLEAGS